MAFHCDTFVIRTRKEHYCEQCGKMIPVGSGAFKYAGVYDRFYSGHVHDECHYASREYAEICDAWGEDYPWFQHIELEFDDRVWLVENYRALAERLGIFNDS